MVDPSVQLSVFVPTSIRYLRAGDSAPRLQHTNGLFTRAILASNEPKTGLVKTGLVLKTPRGGSRRFWKNALKFYGRSKSNS